MALYRLYFVDDRARVERAMDLECDDDAQCIRAALELQDGWAMELWQLGRLVKRFPMLEPRR